MLNVSARRRLAILAGVRLLSLEELDDRWRAVEAAVDATPGIDPWCSGPDWQIPVTQGFAPTTERLLLSTDADDGFLLLNRYRTSDQRTVLAGLEPLWGFGCPIVGREIAIVASEAAEVLGTDEDWDVLAINGVPSLPRRADEPPTTAGRQLTLAAAVALSSLGQIGVAEGITRQIADLDQGYDQWLARRSPKFRRNLRRSQQEAADAGLEVISVIDPDPIEVFDRLMAIEHQSWKGREGSGLTGREMTATYRAMVTRLAQRQRLLVHIATLDGRDVGYILGGLRARRYRGLQLSFSADVSRLSIGNLLQVHQLRQLDQQGWADVYDLGMDFGYKRRWADRAETTVTLVVQR